MILLVDNYDSFTYNLAQIIGQQTPVTVLRNDDPQLVATAQKAVGIVFSPGPGTPDQAGQMEALIQQFATTKPMLGICLGHQAMAEVFGGQVIQAPTIRHGKVSTMHAQANALFTNGGAIEVMRYHSLIVDPQHLPADFTITGVASDDGEIMAMAHQTLPIYGLQFHPESIGTPTGKQMISNFIELTTPKKVLTKN